MYKGALCVLALILAILISSSNALPTKTVRKVRETTANLDENATNCTVNLTARFVSLLKNLNEIKEKVNVTDDDKFNIILREFNFTCSTFTFVMMLKLQLQDYLFDGADESEVSDILHKLTHLETAAAILNDIAVSTTKYPCVVFGPDGYEYFYNDTLAKNMINDQESGSVMIKIDKLLHIVLHDASEVLELIIEAVNYDNKK